MNDVDIPRLTRLVAQRVRAGIRDRTFVPGEIYSVQRIADHVGVSRSPAREALLGLASAGLVRFVRNRGFRILLPDAREIAEIFGVRLALEVPAVRHLARHATSVQREALGERMRALETAASGADPERFWPEDRDLHTWLVDAAGNRRAAAVVAELREVTALLGEPTVPASRTLLDVDAEHKAIVSAIDAGDVDAAGAAARVHLERTARLLMDQVATGDAPGVDTAALWGPF